MTGGIEFSVPFDPQAVLQSLDDAGVLYVLVGGVAMAAQGVPHNTNDIDIVYERSPANIDRLVTALRPFNPRLNVRGERDGVPFLFDIKTISAGGDFCLRTSIGDIDLLHKIDGFGDYIAVVKFADTQDLYGRTTSILSLPALLTAKTAAGRTKDLLVIPEIRAALEVRAKLRALDREVEPPKGERKQGRGR